MKKRILLIALALALLLVPAAVLAEAGSDTVENEYSEDSSGNAFFAGSDVSLSGRKVLGAFGAGNSVTVDGATSEDAVCLAGRSVSVSDSTVGGTLFAAGQHIRVTDSSVHGNIIAAGSDIEIGRGVSSRSVLAAANDISFYGTATSISAGGNKVLIGGEVQGDVGITAENVEILDGAVITGKLTVVSSSEPVISGQARIGDYEFTLVQRKTVEEKTWQQKLVSKIRNCIYWIAAMCIPAVLMCWLAPKYADRACELIGKRPGAVLGSGAVVLVAMPIVFLLLCITLIGAPLACILLAGYILTICLSVMFAGATLARKVFKKMNPFVAAIIGVAVLEIAVRIPYLGPVVRTAAIIYSLGTLLQVLWTGRYDAQQSSAPAASDPGFPASGEGAA